MPGRGRANVAPGSASRAEKVTVPGAARALAVFEIYARERRGITKSEFARLMGLPESSTSDLLNTLWDLGYVTRTVTSRQFYPTSRITEIVGNIPVDGLSTFAAEATSLLASATGESAVFAVASGDRAEIVAAAEGSHRLRYVVSAGDTVSLHATSVGKAVFSGFPAQERNALTAAGLPLLTPHTKTAPAEIEADIAAGIADGVFSAVDEGTVGVSSLAVAGRIGDRPAGLGVIGPSNRIGDRRDALVKGLLEVGESVFDR